MLTEVTKVSQPPGEPRRRWFQSADEDLIVWQKDDGSFLGFQFCWDRGQEERAVTWIEGKGWSYLKVDDGEVEPLTAKRTPVLVPDGAFDGPKARERFLAAAAQLPKDVAEPVDRKLAELARRGQ